jgi:pSer/pThr/pTyr-binding forkhead associated (FHA) protein
LFGLLAVAAAVAIAFVVRKPAAAHAGSQAGTRAGYLPLATATQAANGAPATTPVDTGPGPKFILSNGEHIPLSGNAGSLGRSDFRSLVKPDKADLISRQHIRFDCEDGECYIEDRNSTNGTKLNGSSINGKGRYLLREGDKVELADILTLTFQT